MSSESPVKSVNQQIEQIISEYDKQEILDWLSAVSIVPGNELYKARFEYIFQLLLSIPDGKFGKKSPDEETLKNILETTDLIDWRFYEDWIPLKIGKNRKVFIFDKNYMFFPADLEFPENLVEKIFRFFPLEKQFIEKLGYSPFKELRALLSYQNNMVDFILRNETPLISEKFHIPTKDFVSKWKELVSKEPLPFSDAFRKSISLQQIQKPDDSYFKKESSEITLSPIFNDRIYLPSILLISFYLRILLDFKKIMDNESLTILREKMLLETLISILEQVPLPELLHDFKINSMKDPLDFGAIMDNKFFIFTVLPETFDERTFKRNFDDIQSVLRQAKTEIESGKLKILMGDQTVDIDEKLETFFILIYDDVLFSKAFGGENKTGSENVFFMPLSCFRHMMEDLRDKSDDMILLVKIFRKYNEWKKR